MESSWFTEFADELARCLADAARSADACEALLENVRRTRNGETLKRVFAAVAGPTAVARVLTDLIGQPPGLVLAAAQLCRDASRAAAAELRALDAAEAVSALEGCAAACDRLLEAAR